MPSATWTGVLWSSRVECLRSENPPHFDFVLGRSLCLGKVRILDRSLVCGTIVIFGASNFEVSMLSFDISHLFGLLIIEIGKFYQYRYF